MRIRETTTITSDTATFDHDAIIVAIEELEAQHRAGEIADAAYFMKKRSLIKML